MWSMKKLLMVAAIAGLVTLLSQSDALAWRGGRVFLPAPVPVPHVGIIAPFRPVVPVRHFRAVRPVVVSPFVRVRPAYHYGGHGCYRTSYRGYGYGYGYRYGY